MCGRGHQLYHIRTQKKGILVLTAMKNNPLRLWRKIYYISLHMESFESGRYAGTVVATSGCDGVMASITIYKSDRYDDILHYHSNTNLGFVIDGSYLEEKKLPYKVSAGDICYYSAGESHRFLSIDRGGHRMNLELQTYFFRANQLTEAQLQKAIKNNPNAKLLLLQMYRELLTNDSLAQASIQMLLLKILSQAAKRYPDKGLPQWVNRVDEYMHDHASDRIFLDDLARVAGLHSVTICKYFSKYFGCTAGEYARKLKIVKALRLLKTPGHPMAQIACECGFFDQSHFIREFRKATGFLPGSYRKSNRG